MLWCMGSQRQYVTERVSSNRHLSSHRSGGQKSEFEVHQTMLPLEALQKGPSCPFRLQGPGAILGFLGSQPHPPPISSTMAWPSQASPISVALPLSL